MGFLGGIGKVFSSAFNAVKSFATSGIGKTIIGIGASIIGGPIGGVIANAATSLLSGKFDFKSLAQAGLSAFGGVLGKFNLGPLVQNLPAALKNPTGLLSGLLNGNALGSLSQIASSFFGSGFTS